MDLLRLKAQARGHFPCDNWGGSSSNDGGSSTSSSGAGAGSTGGSWGGQSGSSWGSTTTDTVVKDPLPAPVVSTPVVLSVDSAASSPAPGATDTLSLAQQMAAYGAGKLATDAATGTGTAANGYTSTAGTVNEVSAGPTTAQTILTALKTIVGIAGLGTPAAASSAIGLGTLAASGAYDGFGNTGATVMNGASDSYNGGFSIGVGGSTGIGGTWGSGSNVIGWGGATVNAPGTSAPNIGATISNIGNSLGQALGLSGNSFAPARAGQVFIQDSFKPNSSTPDMSGLLIVAALAVALFY